MAQDIEEVRARIEQMHTQLAEITYYEILELDPDLDQATMESQAVQRFRKLAMVWHADRYNAYDLTPEEREKVQEIFSFINTAHQVLGDAEKRAEYDLQLTGANTDITSILNAESAFRRGQTMLDAGSYAGAHEQFRIAVENHPEEKEYRAHFLYTEYLTIPKNDKGEPLKKTRVQEIYQELDDLVDEMPGRDWLLTFLGVVAVGMGRTQDAEALFNEALQYNPRNVTAQRQKRLIEMRRDQKKGFFAQLKEKLGLS